MNLRKEWIEGKLCEQGLMQETYEGDELVRKLTPEGKKECLEMLKTPEYWPFVIRTLKELGFSAEDIKSFIKAYKEWRKIR